MPCLQQVQVDGDGQIFRNHSGQDLVKQKSTLVDRVAALESRLYAVEGATAQLTKLSDQYLAVRERTFNVWVRDIFEESHKL